MCSGAAKPSITVQPQSREVVYGQEFSLIVVVESPSDHKCALQWYKNYTRLHDKTESRLTVKSAVDSDAGEYYCVAANRGGTVDSDIAFVKIVNPHTFRRHRLSDHQVPLLSSWMGHGPHQWQSGGGPDTSSVRRYYSSEDLIGRGHLNDSQPMSMAGGEGGSGFSSLLFSSRSGSGTTSTGQQLT